MVKVIALWAASRFLKKNSLVSCTILALRCRLYIIDSFVTNTVTQPLTTFQPSHSPRSLKATAFLLWPTVMASSKQSRDVCNGCGVLLDSSKQSGQGFLLRNEFSQWPWKGTFLFIYPVYFSLGYMLKQGKHSDDLKSFDLNSLWLETTHHRQIQKNITCLAILLNIAISY